MPTDTANYSVDNKTMQLYMDLLDPHLSINDVLNVTAYAVMGCVGLILNTLVLITAGRKSRMVTVRSRTNVHYLVFHLTIADFIVSGITMPLEAIWRFSLQWYGDNLSCKMLMVVRALGYYLSSAILVNISIDRCLAVMKPLDTLQSCRQRRRARLMVVASWIISLILSLPQAFMFRKLKHPYVEFYQCTTDMVVEEYSSRVVVAGETKFIFLGVDSETVYSLYHLSFPFFVFFFPLGCLIFNYGIIIKMIRSRQIGSKILGQNLSRKSELLQKSMWTNLRMSMLQVAFFALFWAPYTVMHAWRMFDPSVGENAPEFLTDIFLLTAVFNSCINPVIYGAHYYQDFKSLGKPLRYHNSSYRSESNKQIGKLVVDCFK